MIYTKRKSVGAAAGSRVVTGSTPTLSYAVGMPGNTVGLRACSSKAMSMAPKTDLTGNGTAGRSLAGGRFWLFGIVIIYLIFALMYNIVTPATLAAQHNPDENGHIQYVQSIVAGRLPVFTNAANGPEFHQPPLYYLASVPIYAMTHSLGYTASAHALRFVSTLFGLLLILVAYRTARLLLPDEPFVPVVVAGLVALLPMNVAMNASVGNDSLTNLLVALGLMFVVEHIPDVHRQGLPPPVRLGIVLGLIIITKSSALVLYPAVLIAYAMLGYRKVMPAKEALRGAAMSIGLGILIGSPWLIRNTMLYGDPLAQKMFLNSFNNTMLANTMIYILHGSITDYFGVVAKWTFASFWGVFDSMTAFWGCPPNAPRPPSITAPLPDIYNALAILCGISCVGLIVYFRSHKSTSAQSAIFTSFAILIFATWYGFTRFNLQFFQAQGRYWYTALVPLALFATLGFRGMALRPSWFRVVGILLLAGLVSLNMYTIFCVLIPRFSAPTPGIL